MKYVSTLIAVTDMEQSKTFYQEVLSLEVVADFGANVTLTGGVALQTLETWKTFIHRDERQISLENGAGELYFEEKDMDAFLNKLHTMERLRYVHPPLEHRWGQRVVRFYDPDGHIIEVGEPIKAVVRRFIQSGLSIEETAVRMDVPADYIKSCLTE